MNEPSEVFYPEPLQRLLALDYRAVVIRADLGAVPPGLVDGIGRSEGEGREPGVHLSDVVDWADSHRPSMISRMKEWGPVDLAAKLKWQVGFAFELGLEKALGILWGISRERERIAQVQKQPILMPVDGIYGSPDAVRLDVPVLEEYKSTAKTSRRGMTDDRGYLVTADEFVDYHWGWIVRIAGYLWMLANQPGEKPGTIYPTSGPMVTIVPPISPYWRFRDVDPLVCHLFVLWIRGNYSRTDPNMHFCKYVLTFDRETVSQIWGGILVARDLMLAEKKAKEATK